MKWILLPLLVLVIILASVLLLKPEWQTWLSGESNQEMQVTGDVAAATDVNVIRTFMYGQEVIESLDPEFEDLNKTPNYAPNEIIVKFKSDVKAAVQNDEGQFQSEALASVKGLNEKYQVKSIEPVITQDKTGNWQTAQDGIDLNTLYTVKLGLDTDVIATAEDYESDPSIEYAEPNYVVATMLTPNDPYYSSKGSWGQSYDDLYGLKKIEAGAAWDVTTGSPNVIVGVVDTGLDRNHEDLASNIWVNQDEVEGNGVDDDDNGYIDDRYGWDFYNNDNDPSDDHGHGTHCAGTIAGVTNNGKGVSGVSWTPKVMGLKFLGAGGSGYISGGVDAIKYAADNGAQLTSNSWGGGGISQSLQDAINYAYNKNLSTVVAAGNSNYDVSNYQPAGMDNVITVAASDYNDNKASFSNWGEKVEVAAPGVNILSLRAAGTSMGGGVGEHYTRASGTSMATPHVAGLAALILSRNPSLSADQVSNTITSTADDLGTPGFDIYFGHGRINARTALAVEGLPIYSILSPETGTILQDASSLEVRGSVGGDNFESFDLEWGEGNSPSSWTEINSGNSPISENLLGTWNVSALADGLYTIRLTVDTSDIGDFYSIVTVNVDNSEMTTPADNDNYGRGGLTVEGTATGQGFQNFTVEWGAGGSPSEWSSDHVSLVGNGQQKIVDGELATVAEDAFDASGQYTIRLNVTNGGGTESYTATVFVDLRMMTGWPKKMPGGSREDYYYAIAIHHAPTMADVDQDGDQELLIAHGDNRDWGGWIHIFDENGNEMPGWPIKLDWRVTQSSPVVGDITGDGQNEIIVPSNWGYVYVYRLDGTLLRTFFNGGMATSVTLADIDQGSAGDEVIVSYSNGRINIWRSDGNIVAGWPKSFEPYGSSYLSPAVGDIDNDGDLEIVHGSVQGQVMVWQQDGTPLPGWPVNLDKRNYYSSPALGDVDNDGDLEIAIGTYGTYVGYGNYEDNELYLFNDMGHVLNGWPHDLDDYGSASPAFANLDDDDDVEVVITSPETGSVFAWNGDGSTVSGDWPYETNEGNEGSSAAIGDINNDNKPDVVYSNLVTRYTNGYFGALDNEGSMLPDWPVETDWYSGSRNAPAIGDMDGDGDNEVAIITDLEYMVYVWDLAGGGAIDWPMFQHDAKHTGTLPADPPAGQVSAGRSTITVNDENPSQLQNVEVTVTIRDARGNPMSGRKVAVSASPASAEVSLDSTTTDASGEITGMLEYDQSGKVILTATETTSSTELRWPVEVNYRLVKHHPDGTLIKKSDDPTVYMIDDDLKRPFNSADIFLSHFDWDDMVIVGAEEYDSYNLGPWVDYPPGTLIRSDSWPAIFVIGEAEPRDVLRPFVSMDVFNQLGYRTDTIKTVPESIVMQHVLGSPVYSSQVHPSGTLIKDPDSPAVFYTTDHTTHAFASPAIFLSRFKWGNIIQVSRSEMNRYSPGSSMTLRDGLLVRSSSYPTIYATDQGLLRPFNSGDVFLNLGYNWNNIWTLPDHILDWHQIGPPMSEYN